MNASIINIAFIAIIGICLLIGVLSGFKGFLRSTVGLACVVLSAVFALVLTNTVLTPNFGGMIAEAITSAAKDNESIKGLIDASPTLGEYLPALVGSLSSPLLFFAAFVVLSIIFGIIGGIIKAILKKVVKFKIPFSRLIGCAVSLVASAVVAISLLMPFAGYMNVLSDGYVALKDGGVIAATDEGKGIEDIMVNGKNQATVKLVYSLSGGIFDGLVTIEKTTETDGQKKVVKVNAKDEIALFATLAGHILDLTETDFSDVKNIDVKPIYDLTDDIKDAGTIKTVVAEILAKAATEWKNGNEFLGLNLKEQLPDGYKNSLDAALEKLSKTTDETIVYTDEKGNTAGDLPDLAHAVEALVKLYSYSETLSGSTTTVDEAKDALADALKALTPGAADVIGDAVKDVIKENSELSDSQAEIVADIVADSLKKVAEMGTDEEKEKEAEALNNVIAFVGNNDIGVDADSLVAAVTESKVIKSTIEAVVEKGNELVSDEKDKEEVKKAVEAYRSSENYTEDDEQIISAILALFGIKG